MAKVKEDVLIEIVRRVVQAVQPEKIVLFGSAALGNMGPDSDIDLLVIKSGAHRRRTAQSIYLNLFGIGQGVDIIVVTPEDIEMYHSALGLIIGPALEQGKVIYEQLPNDGCVLNGWDGAILGASTALRRSDHVN